MGQPAPYFFFDHIAQSRLDGTPQAILCRGSLKNVIKLQTYRSKPIAPALEKTLSLAVFRPGHAPHHLRSDSRSPCPWLKAFVGHSATNLGRTPDGKANGDATGEVCDSAELIASTVVVTIDICLYVGQNAYAAIDEFALAVDLVSTVEDLKADAARVLGEYIADSGYVGPWKNFFNASFEAGADAVVTDASMPEPLDHDVTEVKTVEYLETAPGFHGLAPRYGAGSVGPQAPDLLGSGAPPPHLVAPPESEAVMDATPEAAEPIKTGWSSYHFIQPKGVSSSCLNIYSRGFFGCNMVHLMLGERAGSMTPDGHAIIRYLIDLYGPRLVNTPHQKRISLRDAPSLYEGKSPLHQAILAQDAKLVQFLTERGADTRARCSGSFFRAGQHAYYGEGYFAGTENDIRPLLTGEFPGSFAVCTGQKEVARFLFEHEARLNEDRDVLGNYALHMAVKSDRIAAYDLLVEELGADTEVLNIAGETPLQLAVRLNRKEMFYHILFKSREVCWQYGSRINYNLNLRSVDGISRFSSRVSERQSALEVIVQNDYIDLLNSMPVVELVRAKWKRGARGHYFATMVFYCLGLVFQTLLAQHRRFGVVASSHGTPEPVLKKAVQSLAMCDANFSQVLNGTTVWGTGVHNCDEHTTAYADNSYDAESLLLEWGTFSFAVLYTAIEAWDISRFLLTSLQRAHQIEMHAELAPKLPALYPVTGGVILDSHRRRLLQPSRTRGVSDSGVSMLDSAALAVAGVGAVSKGDSVDNPPERNSIDGLMSMRRDSLGGLKAVGFIAAMRARKSRNGRRRSSVVPGGFVGKYTPVWLRRFNKLAWALAKALLNEYVYRQPTIVLIWVYLALVFAHFSLFYEGTIAKFGDDARVAAASICGWIYLLHFARGFQFVGHLVVIIMKILTVDIVKWACVYLTFVTGFGIALYLLVRDTFISPLTTLVEEDFNSIGMSIYRLFRHSLGDHAFESVSRNTTHNDNDLTIVVLVAFTVFCTLIMTNLLIAMMNDTFVTISADALRHWHMQWAFAIIQMERRFNRLPLGQLAFGRFWSSGKVKPVAADELTEHGTALTVVDPELKYLIINVEENVLEQDDGAEQSSGDIQELHARDRLRRNVRWMSGVPALAAPSLSEIDNLLEKHRATPTGDTKLAIAKRDAGRTHAGVGLAASKGGKAEKSMTAQQEKLVAADVRIEDRPCPACTGGGGSTCSLFVGDVRELVAKLHRKRELKGGHHGPGGTLARRLQRHSGSFRTADTSTTSDAASTSSDKAGKTSEAALTRLMSITHGQGGTPRADTQLSGFGLPHQTSLSRAGGGPLASTVRRTSATTGMPTLLRVPSFMTPPPPGPQGAPRAPSTMHLEPLGSPPASPAP